MRQGKDTNMIFTEMIGDLVMALFFAGIVVGNIVRAIALFKCLGKKECSNRNCHLKVLCHRYREEITQEDVDSIAEMLNQKRRELAENDS